MIDGTHAPGHIALDPAFQQQHDCPALRRRCHEMASSTRERVADFNGLATIAPDDCFGQMVPIPVRCNDAEALRRQLFEVHHIEVPVTRRRGHTFVRLAVQAYNTQAELDTLVWALGPAGV